MILLGAKYVIHVHANNGMIQLKKKKKNRMTTNIIIQNTLN